MVYLVQNMVCIFLDCMLKHQRTYIHILAFTCIYEIGCSEFLTFLFFIFCSVCSFNQLYILTAPFLYQDQLPLGE